MEHPTQLCTSIGGYFGRSYTVELEAAGVRYRSSEEGLLLTDESVKPTDQAWSAFRQVLDSIGAWDWSSTYVAPGVVDGTSWSFEIVWGDRTVASSGSNEFPPDFQTFLQAVSQLVGGRDFA